MYNESSLTPDEFKEQIIKQIKTTAPSSNVTKDDVVIKVKLTEDSDFVDFHSFKITVNIH